MQKALGHLPVFDRAAFDKKAAGWKETVGKAGPGGNRVVVEWSVNKGPNCFVYAAGHRDQGANVVTLSADVPNRESDERWADFLEYRYVPQVVQALQENGLSPQVICVDLRPLQLQRARRRALVALGEAKTGVGH